MIHRSHLFMHEDHMEWSAILLYSSIDMFHNDSIDFSGSDCYQLRQLCYIHPIEDANDENKLWPGCPKHLGSLE
jgi:hypothetical protein